MNGVLAIDQGLNLGWAYGTVESDKPAFGVIRLPTDGDNYGPAFEAGEQAMEDLISLHQPKVVAFESPMVVRGNNVVTTQQTIRLLFGLAAIVELVALRREVQSFEVNNMTWKKHFVGSGRATKEDTKQRCRALGWGDLKSDAADACGMFAYSMSVLEPKFSYRTTPLYGGRA